MIKGYETTEYREKDKQTDVTHATCDVCSIYAMRRKIKGYKTTEYRQTDRQTA